MITLSNKFNTSELVYLVTDIDQLPRMVTGIKYCIDRTILYELTNVNDISWHYEQEMTREKIIF